MSGTYDHLGKLSQDDQVLYHQIVGKFDDAWQQAPDHPPDIGSFLPEKEPLRSAMLLELARIDLERRLKRGEEARVEDYLNQYPELAADQKALLALIVAEYMDRRQDGEVTPEDYCMRFPDLSEPMRLHLAQAMTLAKGPRIPGYKFYGVIGRGSMGVVYRAWHVELERFVALKMIRDSDLAAAAELARFRSEAKVLAQLQHSHVVQIHDIGEQDGLPFFSMELVEGGSLAQQLGGTPLPACEGAQLVETLARTVHAAHRHGIVHCDLKPANVLLSTAGRPKITDFGLARRLDAESGQTQSSVIKGTPSYMAPEQTVGRNQEIGPSADVYALGAILYEILTGRPPFKAATVLETLEHVRSTEPVPPSRWQPNKVPRDLETICLKCLEKQPHMRYLSAEALAEDLRHFLEGRPIQARPVHELERLWRWCRRNPVVASLLTVLGVVLVIVSWQWWRAEVHRAEAEGQRNRAQVAEREVQRRLAESYADTAKLAVQRGEWRSALENYNKALNAGYADSVSLRLGKLKAFMAVSDAQSALEELEALSHLGDLGSHEGEILLWQADFALDHQAVETAKTLELVREALKKGLPPAEEAYASGLLAETSPEAVEHFQRAAALEPFHHRANSMLALLLILLGRFQEARDVVALGERLFPEDPQFKVLPAIISALHGDMPSANDLLERTRDQLGEAHAGQLRVGLELLNSLCHQYLVLQKPHTVQDWLKIMGMVADFLPRDPGVREEKPSIAAKRLVRLPPILAKGLGRLVAPALMFMRGNFDEGIDELSHAVQIHPEGTLHYLRGLGLVRRSRWEEAEEAFRLAAETPAAFPIHRQALLAASGVQAYLALQKHPQRNVEMEARAVKNVRKLLALGPLTSAESFLSTRIARKTREFDLARLILADWERQDPGDLRAIRNRVAIELESGAYSRAIAAANQLFTRVGEPGQHSLKVSQSDLLYELAAVYALMSEAFRKDANQSQADRDHLPERYTTSAVELLVKARVAGYFSSPRIGNLPDQIDNLKADPDFNSLRSREDFQKLLNDLEKVAKPGTGK